MKATELIKKSGLYGRLSLKSDFEVKGMSCNSKNVAQDFIFVAIKGNREDGNIYIEEALNGGASLVVAESPRLKKTNASFLSVKSSRIALAKLAGEFYGNPSKQIKTIGITGTNGKTTISYLIEAILKEAGANPGVIGTINHRFSDIVIPSKNTTPGPVELQSILAQMKNEGVDYAVMEVSSHALDQGRIEGIDFNSAIFTNLTQDHLDYHRSLGNYFKAKTKLFKNLSPHSTAVINSDDKFSRRLRKLTKAKVISYGIQNRADFGAKNIKSSAVSSDFEVLGPKGFEGHLQAGLIGRHNVYNILAAVSWAVSSGLEWKNIKGAIEKFSNVPGRLERIDTETDFSVFVDYAHTDDALKNVIKTLRPLTQKNIIVVFGCGGERDRKKRPKMGRCVCTLADYAIITNDNPRSEDPQEIIRDIVSGLNKKNFKIIPDRLEAIKKALSLARSGDIVLVAGKGHENYQILNDRTLRFDDREVVRECLVSLNC